jgi:hypothetical protein
VLPSRPPMLRGMSRCLLLKARHRANPSAQRKRFASLLLTPLRASSAVCSVASPPGRGSRHRRARSAPRPPSRHSMRSAPRRCGMRPSCARSSSPFLRHSAPDRSHQRRLSLTTPHAPPLALHSSLRERRRDGGRVRLSTTLRADTPPATKGQAARQRSASSGVPPTASPGRSSRAAFLREERSGNTAPQLLSTEASLHSELSGRLRRSKPGTQSAPALPVSLPANPAKRRGNSLFHSRESLPQGSRHFFQGHPSASPDGQGMRQRFPT